MTRGGRGRRHPHLEFEHVRDALIEAKGFIYEAIRIIKKRHGYDVAHQTIRDRIKEWDLEDWLNDLRKTLTEDCLRRAYAQGIAEGDKHCIFWVLNKWGHLLDWLPEKEEENVSKKGWETLLDYAKGMAEPDPNSEH